MSIFLLDTNIISELCRPAPNQSVVQFVARQEIAYISSITTHELDYGLFLLPEGKRRENIHQTIAVLISKYAEYIIPVGQVEGEIAASFRAARKQTGNQLKMADALIAATSYQHNLTLATRNTKDFEGLNVELMNPFST